MEKDTEILDNIFLSNELSVNDTYFKTINTFSKGYIHSILFIHKRVAQMEYSKRRWYIDDTANTNIYNKNLLAIIVKDDNSFNQLLAFAFLFDQTESSFQLILQQIHDTLNYTPEIIVCDRCIAQFNALTKVFTTSKIFFCRVHIKRSLLKHFKSDHDVMKLYYLTMDMKLKEEELIEAWKSIVKKNTAYINLDETEEEVTDTDVDIVEENDNELFQQETNDVIGMENDVIPTTEKIENLLERAKDATIKKGILCLKDLVEHKENWLPSECNKYGMYRDFTTNRVEGFFGHLKRLTNNTRLPLYLLTDHICTLANTMFNNMFSVELPDEVINKNDDLFKSLTEFAKKVLKSQYNMLNDSNLYNENQYCISCQIRNTNHEIAWPCCHLMKQRKTMKANFLVNYNDLPSIAFRSNEVPIVWINHSKKDIKTPKDLTLMGIVGMVKMNHNTNCRPRNKSEILKRTSSEVNLDEIIPCKRKRFIKKKVIEEPPMEEEPEIEEEPYMEEEPEIEEEPYMEEDIEQEQIEEFPTSIPSCNYNVQSLQISMNKEELKYYNITLEMNRFEKIMYTFDIPLNCVLCEVSTNNINCKLPSLTKEIKTVIFPFLSRSQYGLIAYVDKIIVQDKEWNNCLVHISDGKKNYPYFMLKRNKEIIDKYELEGANCIKTIHITAPITNLKYNSYFILFLIEQFMKKRDYESRTGNMKILNDYITKEAIYSSFRKYKEINESD